MNTRFGRPAAAARGPESARTAARRKTRGSRTIWRAVRRAIRWDKKAMSLRPSRNGFGKMPFAAKTVCGKWLPIRSAGGRDVKYNRFGDTGLVVSRLAFGAMTFGDYDFNGFKANVD